jgi:hypothetical protein
MEADCLNSCHERIRPTGQTRPQNVQDCLIGAQNSLIVRFNSLLAAKTSLFSSVGNLLIKALIYMRFCCRWRRDRAQIG